MSKQDDAVDNDGGDGDIPRVVSIPTSTIAARSRRKMLPLKSQEAVVNFDTSHRKHPGDNLSCRTSIVGSGVTRPKNAQSPSTISYSKVLTTVVNVPQSKTPIVGSPLKTQSSSTGEKVIVDTSMISDADKVKNVGSENVSGRWTAAEHESFLAGLRIHGREWKKVAQCIPTRTSAQIRSHAQKYFAKVSKEQQMLDVSAKHAITATAPLDVRNATKMQPSLLPMRTNIVPPPAYIDVVGSMVQDPYTVETRVIQTLASLHERLTELRTGLHQFRHQSSSLMLPTSSQDDEEIAARQKSVGPPVVMAGRNNPGYGPATEALELEQKSLRKAAEARHELKRQKSLSPPNNVSPIGNIDMKSINPQCAHNISCTSMSASRGGFDSEEVIALSLLGGSLEKKKKRNAAIRTIESADLVLHNHNLLGKRNKAPSSLERRLSDQEKSPKHQRIGGV